MTAYGFWTLNGYDCGVITDGFVELERETMGSDRRMFDGTLRSSKRTSKRAWRGSFYFATEAEYQAFRTALGATGSTVALDGSALAAPLEVKVTVAEAPYGVSEGGTSWYRTATVTCRAV